MKNKRKFNNFVFLSIVFMLVFGYSVVSLGKIAVSAAEDTQNNSGGFIIETEKVDGAMDLLGALQGKINISEGKIYGLTITKTIDRGGEEPFVIKITSPGPIPVKNLHAETVGGSLPNIGGLCKPSKLGWVCLKDVSMKVTEQTVESINLPNATVETCYQSECGALSKFNSTMSKEELQEKIKEIEEQQSSFKEKMDGLEEDKQKLSKIKELVKQAQDTHEKIKKDKQAEKLEQSIQIITDLLSDEEKKKLDLEKVISLIEALEPGYASLSEITSTFKKTLDQADNSLQELIETIKQKEEQLAEFSTGENELSEDEIKQLETYMLLMEQVKDQKSEADNNEESKENTVEKIDIATLKEAIDKIKSEIKPINENVEALLEKKKIIEKKLKTIQTEINELKDRFKVLLEADKEKAEGILKEVLESKNSSDGNKLNNDQPQNESGSKEAWDKNNSEKTGNDSTTENEDDKETPESNDETDKATDEKANAEDQEGTLIDQIIDSIFGRLW